MVPRVFVFLAVVTTIVVGVHRYFWARLVRDPAWSRPWRRRLTALLVLLALAVPAGLGLWRWIGPSKASLVSWIGGTWAGALFLLLVVLLGVDLLRGTASLARRLAGPPAPVDPERRRFLARGIAGAAGVSAVGLSGAALAAAAASPEVERVEVASPRWPRAFDGFRIVQLSDLHVGPLLRGEFVAEVVERTNALAPDLVVITGDLVDGSVEELRDAVAPLARLRASHGVLFTTGNHEFYVGVEPWLAHLDTLGIRTLRDERVTLTRAGEAIDVAGIDDPASASFGERRAPDLDRALADRDPSRAVVLLAHQPRQVADAVRLGVDLQLSGHTHGGQIAPFGLLVRLVQPAVKGLHRFGATWLYVSRGTGTWGPPMRLGNPAEITLLTLRADAPS